MIVSFPPGFIRSHLVCHFHYYDGASTALAVINGRHWYCERIGDIRCGRFRLTPITLTAEIVRYLELYRRNWLHCFYCRGVRPQYDGRPCVSMGQNPIIEQAHASSN